MHLCFFKQQSTRAIYYWKCAGLGMLSIFINFVFQAREIIPNALVGIMVVGIGFLLLSLSKLIIDVECGIFSAAFVEKGASLEKQYNMPARLFGVLVDNKSIVYRGNLLSRLFPMGIICLTTSLSGTILAFKVCAWFAVVISLISLMGMSVGAWSYIKIVRKVVLEGCNEPLGVGKGQLFLVDRNIFKMNQ